ncbi:hypothetical protein ZIOFF_010092 [Zingiber officinale]|uniref:HAT C-terminal dimerisation domain-containing protein n=1 Tax=Zingiber officinale TaxID=94328 RepID=A0A8J5LJT5_ZINOF|nr:hypothetical protein ZIOFF_010092 [Zingiber officinale]
MTTYVDHGEANLVNGNEDIQPSTSHPAGDDLLDFDTDVLAIPEYKPPCLSFDSGTGSRMLDDYRSSLCPETVEALFCAKDWLQYLPTLATIKFKQTSNYEDELMLLGFISLLLLVFQGSIQRICINASFTCKVAALAPLVESVPERAGCWPAEAIRVTARTRQPSHLICASREKKYTSLYQDIQMGSSFNKAIFNENVLEILSVGLRKQRSRNGVGNREDIQNMVLEEGEELDFEGGKLIESLNISEVAVEVLDFLYGAVNQMSHGSQKHHRN